jgi:hypothetical protein
MTSLQLVPLIGRDAGIAYRHREVSFFAATKLMQGRQRIP